MNLLHRPEWLYRVTLLAAFVPILFVASASAQTINTVAGDGSIGDGGPATGANLSLPADAVVDSAGNLYIADFGDNRIRKVSAGGVISTVAGNGIPGFYGDGGPATRAALSGPAGVAVDGTGNIYIADSDNDVIRKVDASGIISTIAGNGRPGYSGDGGLATAASLGFPIALTVDPAGDVYFADSLNNRIRKVNTAGIISTVAGSGSAAFAGDGGPAIAASLNDPDGVALDGAGNLYIADYYNDRIRKVNSSGVISTVAGNGFFGYYGDGGAATSAELAGPSGVAVDGLGNIYVADYYNDVVRRISAAGVIATVAGNGYVGFSGDGNSAADAALAGPVAVAADNSGNYYIADYLNERIRKVSSAGVISTVAGDGAEIFSGDGGPATSAQLDSPNYAVPDNMGDLYIADWGNNRIRKVNAAGVISTIAGNGTKSYSGDGGPATNAEFNGPNDVALDGAGDLYIADYYNSRIREVTTGGMISTVAGNGTSGYSGDGGPAVSAELGYPGAVAVDGSGNLYIADSSNNRVRKVSAAGIISTVAGNGTAGYSGDGGPATSAEINFPLGVAVDGAGNLYIADSGNNRIRKVNTSGTISTVAGSGEAGFFGDGGAATRAGLAGPAAVAVDGAGNIYIADAANNRVREVNAAGIISTVAGNGTGGFSGDGGPATLAELWGPLGVALDSAGNLYIGDTGNNRIRAIAATVVAGSGQIGLGSSALTFNAAVGQGNPSNQAITVSNAGGGTLNWTATASTTSGGNWLIVTPASGIDGGTLTLSVNIAGLTANTYTGTITVAATGATNTPETVTVTLNLISSPGIYPGGTVSAASFVPGGAVAPGGIAAVFGAGLPITVTSATNIPLSTNLGGVSVTLNGVAAPLFFVSPGSLSQVTLQVPWELAGQSQAALVATVNGTALPQVIVPLAPAAPGIFTINAQGTGQGAIIDQGPVSPIGAVAAPNGSVPGRAAAPAAPGDFVTIYCTGLGNVNNPPQTGSAGNGQSTTAAPIVTMGGIAATVQFSGLVPTLVGEYQINVQVPANAPTGNAVPVSISIGGVSSNTATMAIQ